MNLNKYYPIFLQQPQIAAKHIHRLFHYLLSHNYEDCTPLNSSHTLDMHISDHNSIITYFDASLLSDAIKPATWLKFDSISFSMDALCSVDQVTFDIWPLNQKCEYLHSQIIKAAKATLPYILKKPKDLESLIQSY
ncbi:hypothetical protein RhiirC2_792323 [Rhizophagus irregularis]|uniref:Uncharacterized protein n=1 Tax=Rhizophagus irregularis TaxID=588596 RepID=A0A2N1MHH4_9GLOM|nr:hypothetical protein RhiirC2_792323 [Rhizophagus irregularis]